MDQTSSKNILVVDDEEGVRLFLQTALEDAGFKVDTAVDGLDALEKVRANSPDAISLDLVMPKKSGARFLYELRKDKQLSKIPVMLVTAHAKDDLGKKDFNDVMAGKALMGPETYLEKPVSAKTYVNAMKRVLGIEEDIDGSPEELQGEIKELMEGADPERLKEALKALKKD
jgi:two-component system, OmpR family, alkaline phosphatase synthesis response regulator PhoP